jgi:hypothetical protein
MIYFWIFWIWLTLAQSQLRRLGQEEWVFHMGRGLHLCFYMNLSLMRCEIHFPFYRSENGTRRWKETAPGPESRLTVNLESHTWLPELLHDCTAFPWPWLAVLFLLWTVQSLQHSPGALWTGEMMEGVEGVWCLPCVTAECAEGLQWL